MAGWIKTVLGMEVGLGPGHIVLDGDPTPSQKRGRCPVLNLRPISIVAKRLDASHATWYGGRPQPRRLCVRWGRSPLPKKGAEPPNFRPMFVAAKRLDGSRCHLVWRYALAQATLCKMGTQPPPQEGGGAPIPNFLAHVFCGQTAGWIKMPLGTGANLGPGDVVLDGVAAPP